MVENRS